MGVKPPVKAEIMTAIQVWESNLHSKLFLMIFTKLNLVWHQAKE